MITRTINSKIISNIKMMLMAKKQLQTIILVIIIREKSIRSIQNKLEQAENTPSDENNRFGSFQACKASNFFGNLVEHLQTLNFSLCQQS